MRKEETRRVRGVGVDLAASVDLLVRNAARRARSEARPVCRGAM